MGGRVIARYRYLQACKAIQWDGRSVDLVNVGDRRDVAKDGTLTIWLGKAPHVVHRGDWIAFDFAIPYHYVRFQVYSDAEFKRLYE